MKRSVFFLFFLIGNLSAQEDIEKNLVFSGYLEAYFSYDFNRPEDHLRPDFLYNFKRHNELSINIAILKGTYQSDKIRGNLALMAGTYAQYNLAQEPNWAQYLNEVSLGIKLHEKLWLDVGVMPSYIGFESWYGRDCINLTRSLLAENSPYFFTGGKFTFNPNPKWDIQLWLTNGWQNIVRKEGTKSWGIGTGIKFMPSQDFTINYSNYFGNENPDPIRLYRFFNNFYSIYEKGPWTAIAGADFGIQQTLSEGIDSWVGLIASLKRGIGNNFSVAGRAEYYADPNAIILNNGIKVSGFSANLDYSFKNVALFRIEARKFISPEAVFPLPDAGFSQRNFALTGSMSVWF